MSTAEVEAALTEHPAVAEAAVVSRPHKVKGECLYCFVTLKDNGEFNRTLVEELKRMGETWTQRVFVYLFILNEGYWKNRFVVAEAEVTLAVHQLFE